MTVLLQTTGAAQAQWLAAATGGLLLTAVLTLWRRSAKGTVLVLALQGACLALLALTVAAREADVELFAIAVLTLVVKVAVIPTLLSRVATTGEADETTPVINPTTGMLLAAALTTLAYLVTRSLSLPVGAARSARTSRKNVTTRFAPGGRRNSFSSHFGPSAVATLR